MNFKALVFTVAGAAVALFYALECFLSFQAHGFTSPLITKLLVLGAGAYFCWRNARRIKKGRLGEASENAA